MSLNSYKTPFSRSSSTVRSTGFSIFPNHKSNQKKSLLGYFNNEYIYLGWLGKITEKFDKFSRIGTIAYQFVALGLLTLGLILAFQNFNSTKTSENAVSNTRIQIAKTEEKRIWTDVSSIDKIENGINFNIVPVKIAEKNTSNTTCSLDKIDAKTQFSSDSSSNCDNKTKEALTKIPQTKFAKVKTSTVKVEKGESLSFIAASNKITVSDLIELNGLKSNNLKVGQDLLVPLIK